MQTTKRPDSIKSLAFNVFALVETIFSVNIESFLKLTGLSLRLSYATPIPLPKFINSMFICSLLFKFNAMRKHFS
ncbi:hypothetical protein [Clostridioides sp. ZZV15-6388]|uniref:hypothetical protein n=1 Tax=Clostridioides sp. ZZV15-6388 TaxID=2811499 RepID=UPI001D0F7454